MKQQKRKWKFEEVVYFFWNYRRFVIVYQPVKNIFGLLKFAEPHNKWFFRFIKIYW